MTLDEFKDYAITHLWKRGDSQVIAALDTLIKTAEDELERSLKIEDRITIADLEVVDKITTLPPDYRSMRAVYDSYGELAYCAPSIFADRFARKVKQRDYTVANNQLILPLMGSLPLTTPVPVTVWYYAKIPRLVDGASWLVDNYFDVFLYCVLKHSAPFLREDERLPLWGTLFNAAFASAMEENDERKFAGSPMQIKFGVQR